VQQIVAPLTFDALFFTDKGKYIYIGRAGRDVLWKRVMSLEQVLNFYQITADIGTSGQPRREQFERIAEQGYTSVINLAMHNSDNAIPDEGNVVTALGMSYFHIPVPFDQPTAQHVKKFIHLLNALEGEKVFVHCALNARVSAFMYKYLTLCKGQTAESSTSPLLRKWLPTMDAAWTSIMNLSADEVGLGKLGRQG